MMTDFASRLSGLLTLVQSTFLAWFGSRPEQFETLSAFATSNDVIATFSDDGTILSRIELREDGIRQEDDYQDGVRTERRLIDVSADADWMQVTNTYDETGRIGKVTVFDDGQLREETFLSGIRVRMVQSDSDDQDLFDWTTRDVAYDSAGAPLSRLTRYDDGTAKTETFSDGTPETITQEDLVLTARLWNTIETAYDSLGRALSREMTFDDGVLRTDQFSAGFRQQTVIRDTEDAEVWEQIVYVYDFAGVLVSRLDVRDSGDMILTLYEDGTRFERVEQDVDGDMPWEVQIVRYDANGVDEVIDYEDGSAILADYAPFFATDELIF